MKNILEIYKNDCKKIFTNWAAIIVLVTLCILPSLYAWFNIKACWDPYAPDATANIKVAIVNEDTGTDFNGQKINMGDDIVTELNSNRALGWEFTNYDQAYKELENEEIYAVVTIPQNFSTSVMSILTDNVTPANINYLVNEKINAIAPKITDKGALTIQQNVNQTIVSTISSSIFNTMAKLGINLQDSLPMVQTIMEKVKLVESNFNKLNTLVNNGSGEIEEIKSLLIYLQQELPNVSTLFDNAEQLTSSIQSFITTSEDEVTKISPIITSDISLVGSIGSDVSSEINNILNGINEGNAQITAIIDNTITKIDLNVGIITNLKNFLTTLNNFLPSKPLDSIITKLEDLITKNNDLKTNLNTIKNDLNSGNRPDINILNKLQQLGNDVSGQASNLVSEFNSQIQPNLNNILSQAYGVANQALNTITSTKNQLPNVSNIINQAINIANEGGDVVSFLQQNLPSVESAISGIVTNVDEATQGLDIEGALNLITKNAEQRADFMKSPVTLNQSAIFNMGNYGSAMTPFYTVLCLWVGSTLLVSILKVNANSKYKAYENYFGRLLLFVIIGIIQALLVSLGDLYLLHIYCINPLLFITSMVFVAICFNIIVYSLVSLFGNAGKVIAIVLLVLQVAAGGGTYPVQLMSEFFQNIAPYLPFTYAISFGREAIGGVVPNIVDKDIIFLIIYSGIIMVVTLIFKKYANRISEKFDEKFSESGLSNE